VILLVAAVAAALPNLAQRYSTLRYLADFAPLVIVVAYLGATVIERAWAATPWRVMAALAPVTAWSIVVGALVASGGRYDVLPRHNPIVADALGMTRSVARLADGEVVATPIHAQFGAAATIAAFRFEPEYARPGEPVWLTLWWRPGPQPQPLDGQARVVAKDFRPLALAPVALRPASIAADGWTTTRVRFDLPLDTPNPDYLRVELALWPEGAPSAPLPVGGGDRLALGPLRVAAVRPWPPSDVTPRDLRFGNDLRLVGVRTQTEDSTGRNGPADWLNVTLFWAPSWSGGLRWEQRTLTIELLDAAGRVALRSTGDPGDGWYPTRWWQPGDRITDDHWLELPPHLPPGDYRVRLSMRWSHGEAIPRGDPVVATVRLP
ncbi:MAG: hypothetical protein NZ518_07080, partial [Dehalococcoidia bacterium]|nr:hypothetical protein [Dehalococcoidia bacterium]